MPASLIATVGSISGARRVQHQSTRRVEDITTNENGGITGGYWTLICADNSLCISACDLGTWGLIRK